MNPEILAGLRDAKRHTCAQCLKTIARAFIAGPEQGGTLVHARCHSRVMSAIIPDVMVEDGRRFWWFLEPDDGKPFEDARAKRKRELAEELARVRAARSGE